MVRENIPAIWMGTIGHGFLNLTKWVFYTKIVNGIYIVREGIRGKDPDYIEAWTRWLRKPKRERIKLSRQ